MTGDPDLLQAIVDMRSVYAELRAAKLKLRSLNESTQAVAYAATRAMIADLRGRIFTRAERLAMDADGLSLILSAEYHERTRLRRKPSAGQMVKALRRERQARSIRLVDAEQKFEAAQAILEKRRAEDAAGRSACTIYTGFDR